MSHTSSTILLKMILEYKVHIFQYYLPFMFNLDKSTVETKKQIPEIYDNDAVGVNML